MLKELIIEIDKDTESELLHRELINQGQPTLTVLNLDGDQNNKWYQNSIIRKADELGIKVYTDIKTQEIDNILILKPYNRDVSGGIYEILKEKYKDVDVEPIGRGQLPTIKAISRVVDELGRRQNVLIANRSEDLGLPLAKELVKRDHTVTVGHSKSKTLPIRNIDIIISATGKGVDEKMFERIPEDIKVIDVSNDFFNYKHRDNHIGGIGLLTTSYLFNQLD